MTTRQADFAVLYIGQIPETVDYGNPALQPGTDAAQIHAGVESVMREMGARGWHADLCLVPPDETAATTVERQLGQRHYDCVVIGAGIRTPPKGLLLFERLVNAVHRAAPQAALAFNTNPLDTAEAAERWRRT